MGLSKINPWKNDLSSVDAKRRMGAKVTQNTNPNDITGPL